MPVSKSKNNQLTFETITDFTGISKSDFILTGIFHLFVIFLLLKLIFGDLVSFFDAVKYNMKPDWISWWQGEGWDDAWNEFKLGVFMFLCVALYIAELAAYRFYIKDIF